MHPAFIQPQELAPGSCCKSVTASLGKDAAHCPRLAPEDCSGFCHLPLFLSRQNKLRFWVSCNKIVCLLCSFWQLFPSLSPIWDHSSLYIFLRIFSSCIFSSCPKQVHAWYTLKKLSVSHQPHHDGKPHQAQTDVSPLPVHCTMVVLIQKLSDGVSVILFLN